MEELHLAGLVKGQNRFEIINEIKGFYLKEALAEEHFKWNENRMSEKEKAIAKASMPMILLKLDLLTSNQPDTEFGEVFKLRNIIKLSPGQTDSLIFFNQNLYKLSAEYLEKNQSGYFDSQNYIRHAIGGFLTAKQLETYLLLKSQPAISNYTMADIEKLRGHKLYNGSETDNIYKEVFAYNTRLQLAKERNVYTPSRDNLFAIEHTKATKPEVLKKLELLDKRYITEKSTTW